MKFFTSLTWVCQENRPTLLSSSEQRNSVNTSDGRDTGMDRWLDTNGWIG